MTPAPRRIRHLSAVVLLSTLLVVSSRATPVPTESEILERWRNRLPADAEHRRQKTDEWAARARATAPPHAETAGFHAGGATVCEPLPTNPLLEPLAFFEDEAGEEPPVGDVSRYFFADFDGDGDLDLFVGDKYGEVRYLENVGTAEEPELAERTGPDSPTGALDLSPATDDATDDPFGPSAPTLVDVDGDGDLDLFVGTGASGGGRVLFFENGGSGNLLRDDAGNPLAGFVFGSGYAAPHFVDVDGDGDFDAFVGTKSADVVDPGIEGELFFLRNEGTAGAPSFVDRTDQAGIDPFAGVDFQPFTAPFFADIDGDGDLDAFVGNTVSTRFFENVGGGAFVEVVDFYANPLAGSTLLVPAPAFADLDDDGDLDAFLGGGFGKTTGGAFFFENGGSASDPAFLSTAHSIELADIDGDGDLDALVGLKLAAFDGESEVSVASGVGVFLNTGTDEEPRWELQSGADNPFSTFNATYEDVDAAPTVGDLDGDGQLEAFVGGYSGYLEFLEFDPVSGQFVPGSHPLDGAYLGYSTDPHLADLDGDGELDLIVGYSEYDDVSESYTLSVAVFLNPPGPDELDLPPDFVVDLSDLEGSTVKPTLADVDGDGDLDLLTGVGYSIYGNAVDFLTFFVENPGSASSPAFDGSTAQLVEVAQGGVGSPAAGDLDGDGLLDLVLGSPAGAEIFLTEAIGVTVDPTGPLTTTEAGGGDTFTVVLDRQPAGAIVLDVASTDPGEGTVSPLQLTFGPADWNVPQTVTVRGADDPDPDGPQPYDVAITVDPLSSEPCVAQPVVPIVNLDDEAALLAATKEITGGDLRPGGTVVYTVTVTNVGALTQPDDPAAAELLDTLPPELTLQSAVLLSGPGTVSQTVDTVRWDGALDPGASATIEVTATIDAAVPPGTEIANQGQVFSDNDTDGDNESSAPTDDPTTPEPGDPAVFAAAAPSVTEIPTLSEWGAGIFAALLSLLGLLGLRRRP